MLVSAILRAKGDSVVTVPPATAVGVAARRMQMEHVGALVVSGDGQSPLGIVDERDIVRAYVRHGHELGARTVGEIMRTELITCAPDEHLRQVMAKMTRHRVRHIPVFENGVLRGIVSIGDVVKNRLEELELEKDVLRDAYFARA